MRYMILQKVKDAHRIVVHGEKGAEVVPSVCLFFPGQEIVADSAPHLPKARLDKLVGLGLAKEL